MKRRILLLGSLLVTIGVLVATFLPVWAATEFPDVTGTYTIKCNAQLRYLDDTKVKTDGENITKCKTGTLEIFNQTTNVIDSANLTLRDTKGTKIWSSVPVIGYVGALGTRKIKMTLYTVNTIGEPLGDEYVAVMDCYVRIKSDNVTSLKGGKFLGIDSSSGNSCTVFTIFSRWKATPD